MKNEKTTAGVERVMVAMYDPATGETTVEHDEQVHVPDTMTFVTAEGKDEKR